MSRADHADRKSVDALPLFTGNDQIVKIWDRMQRLQVDFSFPVELPTYFMSTNWRRARKVLDVGSGNGCYLRRLSNEFPEKEYVGVDVVKDLVEVAQRKASAPNITFKHASFLEEAGEYDFIIMRLFIQHMNDVPALLNHAASILSPCGSILIIDCDDEARLYAPELPRFMAFFTAYAQAVAQLGRDRDVHGRLLKALERNPAWRLEKDQQLIVSSAIPGNLVLFRDIYAQFIDLVELTKVIDYDFDELRQDWRRWSRLERAYTQIGVRVMELSRVRAHKQ